MTDFNDDLQAYLDVLIAENKKLEAMKSEIEELRKSTAQSFSETLEQLDTPFSESVGLTSDSFDYTRSYGENYGYEDNGDVDEFGFPII